MTIGQIKHRPELVFARICDGKCTYPNVAAVAFFVARREEQAGIVAVAQALFDMLDPLYAGAIAPDNIRATINDLFLDDGGADTANRFALNYALDVDLLADGRLSQLNSKRRRQFVEMTCELAQQGLYAPDLWTEHFLQSGVAAK